MTTNILRRDMEPHIIVSSLIRPYEDIEKVIQSINVFFPDFQTDEKIIKTTFPTKNKSLIISGKSETLEHLLKQIRIQRILDTALDIMSMDLEINSTVFDISRQAAMVGKVSFVLDKNTLGGKISISLAGEELDLWLEEQTWHEGRNEIPRFSKDEFSMRYNGEPTEWFDKRGHPTVNQDED